MKPFFPVIELLVQFTSRLMTIPGIRSGRSFSLIYLSFFVLVFSSACSNHAPGSRNLELKSRSIKLDASKISAETTHILIDKSERILYLYAADSLLKGYPAVFGPDPVNDKRREGDGCTPEGTFQIRALYPHKKWSYFLWIDYPNDASWKKFKAGKQSGKLRPDAKIGGDIGIHGVPVGKDYLVDNQRDWTLGCISLKTGAIQEIYPLVKVGTKVVIRK